jgi:hypothetical protein
VSPGFCAAAEAAGTDTNIQTLLNITEPRAPQALGHRAEDHQTGRQSHSDGQSTQNWKGQRRWSIATCPIRTAMSRLLRGNSAGPEADGVPAALLLYFRERQYARV